MSSRREPITESDSFAGDLLNILALRRVYREPKGTPDTTETVPSSSGSATGDDLRPGDQTEAREHWTFAATKALDPNDPVDLVFRQRADAEQVAGASPELSGDDSEPDPRSIESGQFEVFSDDDGKYSWRLRAHGGQILATGEQYPTKEAALDAIAELRSTAPTGIADIA